MNDVSTVVVSVGRVAEPSESVAAVSVFGSTMDCTVMLEAVMGSMGTVKSKAAPFGRTVTADGDTTILDSTSNEMVQEGDAQTLASMVDAGDWPWRRT